VGEYEECTQHLAEKGLLVSTYEEDQEGDGKVALCWIPRRWFVRMGGGCSWLLIMSSNILY